MTAPFDRAAAERLLGWAKPWHEFGAKPADPAEPSLGRQHEQLAEVLEAALAEIDRLTRLHQEAHAQNERMCREVDRADKEIDQLRAAVARDGGAGAFFLAAWKSANRTIAELQVELARERERTAGLLGAEARP